DVEGLRGGTPPHMGRTRRKLGAAVLGSGVRARAAGLGPRRRRGRPRLGPPRAPRVAARCGGAGAAAGTPRERGRGGPAWPRLAALYAGLVVDHPVTAVDGLAGDPVVARAPARGGDTEVGVGVLDPGELVPDDDIVTAGSNIGTDGQVRLDGGVLDLLHIFDV